VELDNPVAAIEAFLQVGEGQRIVTTVLLPSGEEYQVTECCSLPLQVKDDSRIRVEIADLGMGNFIERPWLTLIQPRRAQSTGGYFRLPVGRRGRYLESRMHCKSQ
jgi:hypothetical protein